MKKAPKGTSLRRRTEQLEKILNAPRLPGDNTSLLPETFELMRIHQDQVLDAMEPTNKLLQQVLLN